MENSSQFTMAANTVKQLTVSPSNDELCILYGLYKQATIGNINIEKPNFYQFKDIAKWESWNNNKGLNVYDAEVNYIKYVNILIKKYKKY